MFLIRLSRSPGLDWNEYRDLFSGRSAILVGIAAFIVHLTTLPLCANGSEPDAQKLRELFTICREAWLSTRQALRSGEGSGRFESGVDGKSYIQADVKVWFSGDKYRVEADFVKNDNNPEITKSTIIYGDQCVLVVDYADIQNVKRCRGRLYDAGRNGSPDASAGFTFNPIWPFEMIKNATTKQDNIIEARKEPNGDLRFRFQKNNVLMQFVASKEQGYNIVAVDGYRFGFDEMPAQTERITWAQQDGIWYIKAFEKSLETYKDGKPDRKITHRLTYSTFRVNPPVDKKLFTLDGAGLFEGSRIINHRQGAVEREYYYYSGKGKKTDSIKDSWQGLPTNRLPDVPRTMSISPWFIGLNAVGVVLVLGGGGMLVRRWSRRSA